MEECVYCGRNIDTPHPVEFEKGKELLCCSEECAGKTSDFLNYFKRFKAVFGVGLAVSLLVVFGGVFVVSAQIKLIGGILMGAGISLLGLTVMLFPFATPQTFSMLNIRKTVRMTRGIGFGVILVGAAIALLLTRA